MITIDQLVEEVDRLCVENPTETRGRMYFSTDGTPCCALGTGMHNLGISSDPFDLEDRSVFARNTARFTVLPLHQLGIESDAIADWAKENYLNLIQYWQDAGLTWGQARDMAKAGITDGDVKEMGRLAA